MGSVGPWGLPKADTLACAGRRLADMLVYVIGALEIETSYFITFLK